MANPSSEIKTTHPLSVPDVRELAKLYRASMERSDARLAGVAEAAAFRVVTAESAALEAVQLGRFVASASA